jgi:hypothetical protein
VPLLLNQSDAPPFRRLWQAAQLVCADLGGEVKAPPDASIAECIRELGEAVGYTPASGASLSLKQQVKDAQEERLRRQQTPRSQIGASALGAHNAGPATCRPPPPAPSEAPSSFISVSVASQSTTSGIQIASLSQVSGDTTRNLTSSAVASESGDAVRPPCAHLRFAACGRQHSSCVRISAAK